MEKLQEGTLEGSRVQPQTQSSVAQRMNRILVVLEQLEGSPVQRIERTIQMLGSEELSPNDSRTRELALAWYLREHIWTFCRECPTDPAKAAPLFKKAFLTLKKAYPHQGYLRSVCNPRSGPWARAWVDALVEAAFSEESWETHLQRRIETLDQIPSSELRQLWTCLFLEGGLYRDLKDPAVQFHLCRQLKAPPSILAPLLAHKQVTNGHLREFIRDPNMIELVISGVPSERLAPHLLDVLQSKPKPTEQLRAHVCWALTHNVNARKVLSKARELHLAPLIALGCSWENLPTAAKVDPTLAVAWFKRLVVEGGDVPDSLPKLPRMLGAELLPLTPAPEAALLYWEAVYAARLVVDDLIKALGHEGADIDKLYPRLASLKCSPEQRRQLAALPCWVDYLYEKSNWRLLRELALDSPNKLPRAYAGTEEAVTLWLTGKDDQRAFKCLLKLNSLEDTFVSKFWRVVEAVSHTASPQQASQCHNLICQFGLRYDNKRQALLARLALLDPILVADLDSDQVCFLAEALKPNDVSPALAGALTKALAPPKFLAKVASSLIGRRQGGLDAVPLVQHLIDQGKFEAAHRLINCAPLPSDNLLHLLGQITQGYLKDRQELGRIGLGYTDTLGICETPAQKIAVLSQVFHLNTEMEMLEGATRALSLLASLIKEHRVAPPEEPLHSASCRLFHQLIEKDKIVEAQSTLITALQAPKFPTDTKIALFELYLERALKADANLPLLPPLLPALSTLERPKVIRRWLLQIQRFAIEHEQSSYSEQVLTLCAICPEQTDQAYVEACHLALNSPHDVQRLTAHGILLFLYQRGEVDLDDYDVDKLHLAGAVHLLKKHSLEPLLQAPVLFDMASFRTTAPSFVAGCFLSTVFREGMVQLEESKEAERTQQLETLSAKMPHVRAILTPSSLWHQEHLRVLQGIELTYVDFLGFSGDREHLQEALDALERFASAPPLIESIEISGSCKLLAAVATSHLAIEELVRLLHISRKMGLHDRDPFGHRKLMEEVTSGLHRQLYKKKVDPKLALPIWTEILSYEWLRQQLGEEVLYEWICELPVGDSPDFTGKSLATCWNAISALVSDLRDDQGLQAAFTALLIKVGHDAKELKAPGFNPKLLFNTWIRTKRAKSGIRFPELNDVPVQPQPAARPEPSQSRAVTSFKRQAKRNAAEAASTLASFLNESPPKRTVPGLPCGEIRLVITKLLSKGDDQRAILLMRALAGRVPQKDLHELRDLRNPLLKRMKRLTGAERAKLLGAALGVPITALNVQVPANYARDAIKHLTDLEDLQQFALLWSHAGEARLYGDVLPANYNATRENFRKGMAVVMQIARTRSSHPDDSTAEGLFRIALEQLDIPHADWLEIEDAIPILEAYGLGLSKGAALQRPFRAFLAHWSKRCGQEEVNTKSLLTCLRQVNHPSTLTHLVKCLAGHGDLQEMEMGFGLLESVPALDGVRTAQVQSALAALVDSHISLRRVGASLAQEKQLQGWSDRLMQRHELQKLRSLIWAHGGVRIVHDLWAITTLCHLDNDNIEEASRSFLEIAILCKGGNKRLRGELLRKILPALAASPEGREHLPSAFGIIRKYNYFNGTAQDFNSVFGETVGVLISRNALPTATALIVEAAHEGKAISSLQVVAAAEAIFDTAMSQNSINHKILTWCIVLANEVPLPSRSALGCSPLAIRYINQVALAPTSDNVLCCLEMLPYIRSVPLSQLAPPLLSLYRACDTEEASRIAGVLHGLQIDGALSPSELPPVEPTDLLAQEESLCFRLERRIAYFEHHSPRAPSAYCKELARFDSEAAALFASPRVRLSLAHFQLCVAETFEQVEQAHGWLAGICPGDRVEERSLHAAHDALGMAILRLAPMAEKAPRWEEAMAKAFLNQGTHIWTRHFAKAWHYCMTEAPVHPEMAGVLAAIHNGALKKGLLDPTTVIRLYPTLERVLLLIPHKQRQEMIIDMLLKPQFDNFRGAKSDLVVNAAQVLWKVFCEAHDISSADKLIVLSRLDRLFKLPMAPERLRTLIGPTLKRGAELLAPQV